MAKRTRDWSVVLSECRKHKRANVKIGKKGQEGELRQRMIALFEHRVGLS